MTVSFQEVVLDTRDVDDTAILVLRDGRLTAVLSRLGAMHEENEGQWFVEALFGAAPASMQHVFADPAEFVAWLSDQGV